MKSFKLISLEVVEDDQSVQVPLTHGLIINKEDEHSTWLIEAYSELSLYDYFKKIFDEKREIMVQVVITKKENDPVFFQTRISCLQSFKDHISVLLEGYLRRNKKDFSEKLLESLLNQGLTGDALLAEFKKQKKAKPKLTVINE